MIEQPDFELIRANLLIAELAFRQRRKLLSEPGVSASQLADISSVEAASAYHLYADLERLLTWCEQRNTPPASPTEEAS